MSSANAGVGTDYPANDGSAIIVSDFADANSRPGRELSQTVLQNSADDDLFKSLLKGAPVEHAARLARVTELTVHQRLADPAFKQRIESGREALRDSVLSQLSDAASDAVSKLWQLTGNVDPDVQLRASKALLDSLVKLQQVELNRRPKTTVTSPVFHDGYLYWMHEKLGIAYCARAETGELAYEERMNRGGQVYASTLLADGRLYYLNRSGRMFVLAAKPQFELLGTNELRDGSQFNASPAVAGKHILLRSDKYLYCLGK